MKGNVLNLAWLKDYGIYIERTSANVVQKSDMATLSTCILNKIPTNKLLSTIIANAKQLFE